MAYLDTKFSTLGWRQQSKREEQLVAETEMEFGQMQWVRNTFANQWEEAAELIAPNYRNTFYYQNWNFPGQKKTDRQIDATGMLALQRFKAICDSLLTPRNMTWHQLTANNAYVMKDRATKLWFEEVARLLFKYRYQPLANFSAQNVADWEQLGAFGNANMFIDALDGTQFHGQRGLRYMSCPLGQMFWRQNHQGLVDGFIRLFRRTAYQAVQQWGIENLPANLRSAYEQKSQYPYSFFHRVCPREDYEPDRMDYRGKPWLSIYVSLDGKCLMQPESGYRTFPLAASRYEQGPDEVYGRGPAQMVLPALKTINMEKRIFLKQGHRAADPVLLTHDDGIIGFSQRPGALNPGGINADGKRMIDILPTGNIQITKEMMADEKGIINDAFLVTLFQILTETPQMTATEVIERINEKGILLAPTIGRQQSERLGPMINRELDVLSSQGLLPPMPPRLQEANGEYDVVYTSPLARQQRAGEAAGFIRTVETTKELVAITQDMSLLDPFNFDVAVKEIADIQVVPPSWMASEDEIDKKRKARAKQMAQKQQIDAAPAAAAMMKARATMLKAGQAPGETQGVLS